MSEHLQSVILWCRQPSIWATLVSLACGQQALPSGELDALLQHSHEHGLLSSGGIARAPSMGKLESMELPDAVAAVVRLLAEGVCSVSAMF